MKLWSSLQEQFLKVKKNQYVPYLLGFMWDFNATASRMPILCFWAPLRKTESQKRTIFFVTQMPIFQHRHTNTSSFVSLLVQNNRCHHSWPSSSEKKFDWVWFYLCCCFFFTFLKCLLKYLPQVCSFQMRRWLILEVKPFHLKEIVSDFDCVSKM